MSFKLPTKKINQHVLFPGAICEGKKKGSKTIPSYTLLQDVRHKINTCPTRGAHAPQEEFFNKWQ
jgi:hypothetical protein